MKRDMTGRGKQNEGETIWLPLLRKYFMSCIVFTKVDGYTCDTLRPCQEAGKERGFPWTSSQKEQKIFDDSNS